MPCGMSRRLFATVDLRAVRHGQTNGQRYLQAPCRARCRSRAGKRGRQASGSWRSPRKGAAMAPACRRMRELEMKAAAAISPEGAELFVKVVRLYAKTFQEGYSNEPVCASRFVSAFRGVRRHVHEALRRFPPQASHPRHRGGLRCVIYALSHVFASLPLGLAYAIWTSAAVALTAVVSRIVWKEKFNVKKIAGVALIIVGVACLRLGAM